MANKERNKRSARKARAEERAQREALQAEATPEASAKATKAEAKKPFSVTLTLASLAAWVLILQAFVQKCTALCGLQALSLLVSL